MLNWRPTPETADRLDSLVRAHRLMVRDELAPLIAAHYPALPDAAPGEYRKMLELSAKMTLVGHACTEIAGFDFDSARQGTAALFGACCFLADSFLDDFGIDATRDYLTRFERLLETGWFDIRTERERLFYVVAARLFARRDVLDPLLRQAILQLHTAQAQDVMHRLEPSRLDAISARQRSLLLKQGARNRSGHAIVALSAFLMPHVSLDFLTHIFCAGALVMFIDDHGDCHTDRRDGRITYMNQVREPERVLRRIVALHIGKLAAGFPPGEGRDLLLNFLLRYYRTRLAKHREQKRMGGSAWDVYE